MGHDGTDNDCNEHTRKDEEHSKVADMREKPVHEKDDGAAKPCTDDKADKYVPRLGHESGMHQGIHGDSLLSQNSRHRSSTEDPGQTVPEAREKTACSAILPRCDGSPVVH